MSFARSISRLEALKYEALASAWWMSWISNGTLQSIAGRYLAWKVNRKYRRIEAWQKQAEELQELVQRVKTTEGKA